MLTVVVLYGHSLGLSTVGAGLEGLPGLQIVTVDAELPDAARQPHAHDADIVVFDAAGVEPDVLTLWKMDPDLLVIGIDMTTDNALVLSGAMVRVSTTNDLVHVIRSYMPIPRNRLVRHRAM
jgi:hypothetical protein